VTERHLPSARHYTFATGDPMPTVDDVMNKDDLLVTLVEGLNDCRLADLLKQVFGDEVSDRITHFMNAACASEGFRLQLFAVNKLVPGLSFLEMLGALSVANKLALAGTSDTCATRNSMTCVTDVGKFLVSCE
jgi:hypothetical protein